MRPALTIHLTRLAAFACSAVGALAHAAPGDLDPTFGDGGIVIDPMNGNDSRAHALAIDADGRVVVAGAVANNGIDDDFGLLRLNADGTPDAGFGSGGRAYLSYLANSDDEAYGLVALADGRLVVGGNTFFADGSGDYPDVAAVRVNADGSIDASFGNHGDGWMTSGHASYDVALAMGAAPDGFVLAGHVSPIGSIDAAALRIDTLGMPLPSFGDAGFVVAASDTHDFQAVAAQPDGKTLLGGGLDSGEAFVMRLDAAGTLDPSFAGDGRAELGGLISNIASLLVLDDGRVLVAGLGLANGDAAILRLTTDGAVDASFGNGGLLLVPPASVGGDFLWLFSLALQADGRIVAAGRADSTADFGNKPLVLRANADGQLDVGFGDGGVRVIDAVAGVQVAEQVALQADGAIVIAGYHRDPPGGNSDEDQYFLARLEGGGGGGPARTVSIADAGVVEGDAGTSLMDFTISLSSPSDGSVTVNVATDLGTATPDVDYVPTTATLAFPDGATTATFQVPVIGDTEVEADETFLVRLSDPVGTALGDALATGTILDDDADEPPPQPARPVPGPGPLALLLLAAALASGAGFVDARRRREEAKRR